MHDPETMPEVAPTMVQDRISLIEDDTIQETRAAPVKPRLLIVDDDFGCAHFLSHAAEECGYEARIAASPEAFQREFIATRPEAVLVDLAMPGTDGIELLRFLARQRSTSLVILASGTDTRVLDAAVRLGNALRLRMCRPLAKPFVVNDLQDCLSRSLAAPQEDRLCCL